MPKKISLFISYATTSEIISKLSYFSRW